jgi:hypothetical protein
LTHINKESFFSASLIYNETGNKVTLEFSGFNNNMEAKSLCYLLMEQFGIKEIDACLKSESNSLSISTKVH